MRLYVLLPCVRCLRQVGPAWSGSFWPRIAWVADAVFSGCGWAIEVVAALAPVILSGYRKNCLERDSSFLFGIGVVVQASRVSHA